MKSLNFRAFAIAPLLCGFSLPSSALLIDFIGAEATDGSGLTSRLIDPSNVMPANSGFFVETFDVSTYTPLPAPGNNGLGGANTAGTTEASLLGGLGTIQQNQGCSINSWGGPAITAENGGFGVRKGSAGFAAAPGRGSANQDNTCFAFGPRQGGGASSNTPATVKVDYSPILAPGVSIDYLGIYYGSIDTYNNIAFYSGDELLTTDSGFLMDGILQGQEILNALNGQSGSQSGAGSNVYVNLFFEPGEVFTAFEFRTSGVAFEFDNVVVGLDNRVPAPATLGLLILGLGGLVLRKK